MELRWRDEARNEFVGCNLGERSLRATRVCSAFTRPSLLQATRCQSTEPGVRVLSAEVEAQTPQLLGITLPVLGDLHMQVEVDLGSEQCFDAAPGFASDRLESAAALADDDRLLAGSFDIEVDVDVPQRIVLAASSRGTSPRPVRPGSGAAHRGLLERGFANEFGDHHLFGFVSELALRVERR